MIGDPYQTLGISRNASDDEVKKAYRELSRKYHPDSYIDNPLASLAEEKFKEVQEAYDQIMNERQYGGGYDTGASGGYNNQGYGYSNQGYGDTGEFAEVYNYINARRYADAVQLLGSISTRNAKWFYLSAVSNIGLGNNILALDHARTAVSMEPTNREYVNFYNQLQYGNGRYQTRGQGYGRSGMDTSDLCCNLCIADTCCECMGGDLCTCI